MKIQSAENFLEIVNEFAPFHDGPDLYWIFFLPVKRKWKQVSVRKYQDVYYIAASDVAMFSYPAEYLNVNVEEKLKIWAQQLFGYKALVLKDPINAQISLIRSIPMDLRKGLMIRKNVRRLISDWANLDIDSSKEYEKMLLEILRGRDGKEVSTLTADQYFEYCRVAYLANPKTFPSLDGQLSGRELYKQYADGRDGGLLSLDPTSPEALKNWFHSGAWHGTHPWEIYRGGNSTHINLSITPDYGNKDWRIVLTAFSTARMVEACRIAIALKKAGLPFTLSHKESYLNRILEEDWVGIVPEGSGIKYAYQSFPSEYGVADCIYLSWIVESFPKEKRRNIKQQLKKLVFWLPERMTAELMFSKATSDITEL
jgi:hypothetical protein